MTKSYNYIIVGAGAAGCVLATRLSENPDIKVLLIEAGEERRSPLLSMPMGEVLLMGNPRYDWCFETEPDPTINNRKVKIPRGKLLGGSNAINGMIFVRGQKEDYEHWVQQGNQGWGWRDVLPYFKKLESSALINNTRGSDGPISVDEPTEKSRLCDAFIQAANQAGYPSNTDYNTGDQEGFGYYQATHLNGVRSSAKEAFLRNARTRPNLTVITGARVLRLILKRERCIGLEYAKGGNKNTVLCENEVVLSAGTIQSPQILELSGIGNPTLLEERGVKVLHSLSGVGENFREHYAVRLKWRINQKVTFNERTRGLPLVKEISSYLFNKSGVLSLPIAIGFGFVKSDMTERTPDLQFHFAPASYGAGSTRRLDSKPGMTIGVYPLRPESRGSIHIGSKNPLDPPVITGRFLESEKDLQRLISGIKIARKVAQSDPLLTYITSELSPGIDVQSTEELKQFIRQQGDTSYHPVGTCKMGIDEMSVVDFRLKVHGLRGLRVIDASIMPTMVSGNTNAATLMIAEKGAAMLLEDRDNLDSVTNRSGDKNAD